MVRGLEIVVEGSASRFSVSFDGRETEAFTLPLLGRHNVYNALAALAVGWTLGLSPAAMREGLAQPRLTGQRFECYEKNGYIIINDAYKPRLDDGGADDALRNCARPSGGGVGGYAGIRENRPAGASTSRARGGGGRGRALAHPWNVGGRDREGSERGRGERSPYLCLSRRGWSDSPPAVTTGRYGSLQGFPWNADG